MPLDTSSDTWRVVEAFAEKRLSDCQSIVAQEDIAERAADVARGEIKALTALLNIVKPQPDLSGSAGGNT